SRVPGVSTQPEPGDTQATETTPAETEPGDTQPTEGTAGGRSGTSWLVVLGAGAAVATNYVVRALPPAGAPAAVAGAGGVLAPLPPRASGLAARPRAFDATAMLSFGVLIAVFAAVVPQ